MPYLQQCFVHDRPARAHRVGKFEIALARHGADFKRAAHLADVGQAFNAVEIDDVVGQHKSHVEHGHQRLTARKQLGVFEAAEQPDRLADCFRIVIAKGWRLHLWRIDPRGRGFFTYTTNCASIQKNQCPHRRDER